MTQADITQRELTDSRESMTYDVIIVGAGPAGLSAAIRLKQLAKQSHQDISVCVLEKGSEPGAHILSGAIMDPIALTELFPNWQAMNPPVHVGVSQDRFLFLDEKKARQFPHWLLPKVMQNKGSYIISLSNFVIWLSEQAEALGVDIFPGFAASHILYDNHTVIGVLTGDVGIDKNGKKTNAYEPGMALYAKYTLFAEGTRGHLGRELIEKFSLDKNRDPQTYGLGIKEVWEVNAEQHQQGLVIHTAGWPLDNNTYGGSFIYHMDKNRIAIGLIVGLNYTNPYFSPFSEFQRFKTHPAIAKMLKNGKRIAYGARAITAGGLQSLPQFVFNGGALIGCEAGFLNAGRLKGIHTAMKSGMLAAQAIVDVLDKNQAPALLQNYDTLFKQSWLYNELWRVRNFKPYMEKGLHIGSVLFGIDQVLFKGCLPWTLHRKKPDYAYLTQAKQSKPIQYPKPDGHLSFDMPSSLNLCAISHNENQPCHLTLKNESIAIDINLTLYAGAESRFCPAGVYEFKEDTTGKKQLIIHASNCLHCKTCDIKDTKQNIIWIAPEGGSGPNYTSM